MNQAERDKLSIKRNGLLALKRLLDTVDKIRQLYNDEEKELKTNLHKLVEGTKINDWNDINALFEKARNLGIANFIIRRNSGINGWGSYTVDISLLDKFDEILDKTRQEYHKINELLTKGEKEQDVTKKSIQQEIIKENSLWKLTHPAHWIYKIFLFFKKHPKISLVILICIIGIILIKFYGWRIESLDLSGPKIAPDNK